jgi:drug/metabolite transporter (DMT)-like permease
MTTQSQAAQRRGVLLTIAAAFCWSLAGIIVRNLRTTDQWEIVFWRSLFSVICMAAVLAVMHRGEMFGKIRRTGRAGVLSGAMWAVMVTFFMLAVTRTTVANALVIMSLAPFLGALMSWIVLREAVAPRTLLFMALALVGIIIMFAESIGTGRMAGNLLALAIPIAYGVNVTLLRRAHRHVDMLPGVLLGSLISAIIALPLALPLEASARDVSLLAFMGSAQLALGCVLFVHATRYLKSAELGLIGLLETLLAPLWVWIGVGERPSDIALAGGAIVLGSLAANEMLALLAERARKLTVVEAAR